MSYRYIFVTRQRRLCQYLQSRQCCGTWKMSRPRNDEHDVDTIVSDLGALGAAVIN